MLLVYERLAREWPKVVILKPRSLGISTLMEEKFRHTPSAFAQEKE